jgi:hypothetical protein
VSADKEWPKLNAYVRVAMPIPEPDQFGHVVALVPRYGVVQVWFGDRDYQWVAAGRVFQPDPPPAGGCC